jgi:uncharacterized protein (TIGR02268 family)
MCPALRALLLGLVLTGGRAAAASPAPPPCEPDVRHLRLEPGAARPPEVCIQAGKATTLLFDRALRPGELFLEDRFRFRQVEAVGSLLVLVPGETLAPGMRLRLEVPFREPGVSATFVLVGASLAERQVEVSLVSRPEEGRSPTALRGELRECREQLGVYESWWRRGQNLAGAMGHFWMTDSLRVMDLRSEVRASPGPGFPHIGEFLAYRASSLQRALRMSVFPAAGAPPWRPLQATLQGGAGEPPLPLELLEPPTPQGPGQALLLHVPPSKGLEGLGPYTLVLVAQDAAPWIIQNVRFP